MEKIEKEKALIGYPKPVTIDGTMTILNQLQNCICKIKINNENGTGFFCSIPYNNETLKVLITNNHIINEDIIKERQRIQISINDDKEYKIIELKNKKIYTNKEFDTTIIEINSEKDNINNYLELDQTIFQQEIININSESVYILQYPSYSDGQKAAVSYGIIKTIEEDGYNIIHHCCTELGSSGSPIVNLLNNKIFGIHKESIKNKNYNKGTLLKFPINEYLNTYYNNPKIKNEINLTMNVDHFDRYSNNYFLINDRFKYSDDKFNKLYKDSVEYYNKLLNESKIEIFINNKKYESKTYFHPKGIIGEYKIKLIFNSNITNISWMFYECKNLINIDLSSFDTKNVNDMNHMFSNCKYLTNIDLSSFDTKNVKDMSYMFSYCESLTNIDLSSFYTKNVGNMRWMFSNCSKLTNIDLSSFDTKNVNDMRGMFSNCKNLINIDLSSFDTKNVKNMYQMFDNCKNLTHINLSSFDTKNVEDMYEMFTYCINLTYIDLSSFDTKNVTNISRMFNCCKKLKVVKINNISSNSNLKRELNNENIQII